MQGLFFYCFLYTFKHEIFLNKYFQCPNIKGEQNLTKKAAGWYLILLCEAIKCQKQERIGQFSHMTHLLKGKKKISAMVSFQENVSIGVFFCQSGIMIKNAQS